MGAFKMHFKMADETKKKSQQYTKEAQVHSILQQLITQFHFYLIDSLLSFIIYVNKNE